MIALQSPASSYGLATVLSVALGLSLAFHSSSCIGRGDCWGVVPALCSLLSVVPHCLADSLCFSPSLLPFFISGLDAVIAVASTVIRSISRQSFLRPRGQVRALCCWGIFS